MTVSHDYSYVSSSDNTYIDGLYADYRKNPESVELSWRQFFKGVEFALGQGNMSEAAGPAASPSNLAKEFKVYSLIEAYRSRGHLISVTNPIRERKNRFPHLDLSDFGLKDSDLEESFAIGELVGKPNGKLKEIIKFLKYIYCDTIGAEYMHINDMEIRDWFQKRFEDDVKDRDFSIEKK